MFFPKWRCLSLIAHSLLIHLTNAYKPISDNFLRNISSYSIDTDFDPTTGLLLSPILQSRVPSTPGHATAQQHFTNFFQNTLPKWTLEWQNTSTVSQSGSPIAVSNLIFQREPPWTSPGQANFLTLAAHYDTKNGSSIENGDVGAVDSAVSCALLMHVARSIDGFMTQMHDEMNALGEGGTVEMDMGIKIVFLDGKESLDSGDPALTGSRALSEHWENQRNPAGSKYPNTLSQISIFVLADILGSANPTVPSYLRITNWVHENMSSIETRLRKLNLLESTPPSAFFPSSNGQTVKAEELDDHIPFMERGVPFLNVLPSPLPAVRHTIDDNAASLDMPTVRDWARIVTSFAHEWLDMMEVWPEEPM